MPSSRHANGHYLCHFLLGDIRRQAADINTGVLLQLKPLCLLGSSLFGLLGAILLPLNDVLPATLLTALACLAPVSCLVISVLLNNCCCSIVFLQLSQSFS